MKKGFTLVLAGALCGATLWAAPPKAVESASTPLFKSATLGSAASPRTVIAQKEMAPGVMKRMVRDASGRIFADIERQGRVSGGRQAVSKAPTRSAATGFFEDFESHQGQKDWLPEGWTEINTDANRPTPEMCAHNINNSWAVENTGDGYWTAITPDGVKECWIHFSYGWDYRDEEGNTVKGGPDPQDEWLITPEINVGEGQDLYFLCEFDLGSAFSFDWGAWEYDRSKVDCDLEVLVSDNGGSDWTSLWKITSDVCAGMTDGQLYDIMADLNYYSYAVSLAPYYGKKVKIAFRYTNVAEGFSGNSAAVDAVTVAAPMPEAFYNLPSGSLLLGITDGLHVLSESAAIYPAYAGIDWMAASNAYTESNEWTFRGLEGQETVIAGNTASIVFPYTAGELLPWPVLKAVNANGSSLFSFDADHDDAGIIAGGALPTIVDGEMTFAGNYDYQHKGLVSPYLAADDYVYGTHTPGAWGNGITQTKIGNLFAAPAAPFKLRNVMLTLGEFDADDDAEFLLEIIPIDKYGYLEEPMATAVVKGADVDGIGFYNMKFHLDSPCIIQGNVLMMVSGFASSKVRAFAACAQSKNNDTAHNYAYMMYDINGSERLYAASDALTDYSSALIMGLNGSFEFIHCDAAEVTLSGDTGSLNVAFTASNDPVAWTVAGTDGEALPIAQEGTAVDWLTVVPVALDCPAGYFELLLEAAPTQHERQMAITLANGGVPCTFTVKQSAGSGVAAIAESFAGVRNGILTLTGISANAAVKVYSAAGQLVKKGGNGMDVRALPHGIYLVEAEGKTLKIAL